MRSEETESLDSPSCSPVVSQHRLVSICKRFLPVNREKIDFQLIQFDSLINLADINCDEDEILDFI